MLTRPVSLCGSCVCPCVSVCVPVCVQCFMKKVVEEFVTDTDYVWIHDYHLLVLPSLLRKSFNKIRWAKGGGVSGGSGGRLRSPTNAYCPGFGGGG